MLYGLEHMHQELDHKTWLELQEAQGGFKKNALSWMLPEPERCMGDNPTAEKTSALFAEHYPRGLNQYQPASDEERYMQQLPKFTTFGYTSPKTAAEFETQLKDSVDLTRASDVRWAKKFMKNILDSDRWWMHGKFNEFLTKKDLKGCQEYLEAWQRIKLPNTRDIEAAGGPVNKASLKACNKGCLRGVIRFLVLFAQPFRFEFF